MFDNAYFVCFISYTYYLVNLAAKLPLNVIFNKKAFSVTFVILFSVLNMHGVFTVADGPSSTPSLRCSTRSLTPGDLYLRLVAVAVSIASTAVSLSSS